MKTFPISEARKKYIASNPYFAKHKLEDVDLSGLDFGGIETYHTGTWGNKPDLYKYDSSKDTSDTDVMYGTRLSDGSIRLGNGRHRARALLNAGYTHATIPVLDETERNETLRKEFDLNYV